ncbi:MAG: curli production assembly protein CsgG [Acidobacteria bacterium]|nr:curli production assembly protein CsgG [Acidobacteriota bacterium]
MRSLILFLTLAMAIPGLAQQKKRIAVLDFEYGTVQSNAAAIFGTNVDIGRGIRDLMVERFVNHGVYSVVERAALDAVLAEQNFSNSDRANPATAAQLGKVLGVDAIVIGSITQFGRDDQSRNVGGGAFGGFGAKYGLGGIKKSSAKAVVGITARIIDTDTAEILAVANGSGESTRGGTSLYGSGSLSGAGGLGDVDMTSSNFGATLIGEAVNQAVDPVVNELESYTDRMTHRVKEVEGLVADYSDGFVILNVGANAGVAIGGKFAIKRVVREVKDPATGQVLRKIEDDLGVALITEVDEVSAVGRFSGDGTPQVGDTAKLVE